MRLRLAILACSTLTASTAYAVEGGSEDRTTAAAVAIAAGSPSAPDVRCSGTLIAPNVVLTVRHCIASVPATLGTCDVELGAVVESIKEFWVTASPWTNNASWKRVKEARVPEPTKICGNDVALLVLDDDFQENEAAVARPVTTAEEFERVAKNRVLGIAAFGATSIAGTDRGVRRSRFDVPLRCVPGDTSFACGAELDYIDVREFTAGRGPCPGDSGAGALVPSERSTVFGVLSRGNLESTCAEGVFVRTDVWAWLIGRSVLDARPPEKAPEWAKKLFPANPKAGELCHGAGSCGANAECVSVDGRRSWTCADRCTGTCASGQHCENGLCLAGDPPSDAEGGCQITKASEATSALPILLALVLAGAAKRASKKRATSPSSK